MPSEDRCTQNGNEKKITKTRAYQRKESDQNDEAISYDPEAHNRQVSFWTAAHVNLDPVNNWLANKKCGNRRDDQAEGCKRKFSPQKKSNEQWAENKNP